MFDVHSTYLFDRCQKIALAKSQPSPTDLAAQGDMVIGLQDLSDPVRLEIVRQMAGCDAAGEWTCGERGLPVTKSTGSHPLKLLSAAGVIAEREEGTRAYLSLR